VIVQKPNHLWLIDKKITENTSFKLLKIMGFFYELCW